MITEETLSLEQIGAIQEKAWAATFRHASANSPFYCERFRAAGLSTEEPPELRQLALIHKHSLLAFTDDQLRPKLYFVVVSLETVDECVVGIVGPFDDVDELAADLVEEAHGSGKSMGKRENGLYGLQVMHRNRLRLGGARSDHWK